MPKWILTRTKIQREIRVSIVQIILKLNAIDRLGRENGINLAAVEAVVEAVVDAAVVAAVVAAVAVVEVAAVAVK